MQASHVSINHHPSYGHSSSIPLLDGIDPFSNPKDRGFSLNWVFHVKFQCTLIFCLVVSFVLIVLVVQIILIRIHIPNTNNMMSNRSYCTDLYVVSPSICSTK